MKFAKKPSIYLKPTFIPTPLKDVLSVDKLYLVHYFAYSKNFRFEGETHDFWEMIYCDAGEAEIQDEETSYQLLQGHAFLHAPNHFHNVKPDHANTNVIVIGFGGNLDALFPAAGKLLELTPMAKTYIKTILNESRRTFAGPLNRVYQYRIDLKENAQQSAMQTIKNCLECLFLTLLENPPEEPNDETQNATARLILKFLNDNIGTKINLQILAYKIGYSPAYLQRIFKQATGMSIMQYFIGLKIERAKEYISEEKYSFSEIAEMLGYDTVQYFSKQFKDITNMSPAAYEKSIRDTGILN